MMLGMSDAREGKRHEQLRDERKRRGWTQQQVAKAADVSVGTYQGFELGKRVPQPENRKRILRALGLEDDAPEVIGPEVGRATRDAWPIEVQIFRDTIGAYLMTMEEDERMDYIREQNREILRTRHDRSTHRD